MFNREKTKSKFTSQVNDLRRFRDIGGWFTYMGTDFNVSGHFVVQNVDGDQRKLPMIRASYVDNNGIHQSRQFNHSMLPALYKENKETQPSTPVIDTSEPKKPVERSYTETEKLDPAKAADKPDKKKEPRVLDKKVVEPSPDPGPKTQIVKPPKDVIKAKPPTEDEPLEKQQRYTYVDMQAAFLTGYDFATSTLKAQNADVGWVRFMAKLEGTKKH